MHGMSLIWERNKTVWVILRDWSNVPTFKSRDGGERSCLVTSRRSLVEGKRGR